MAKFKVGDVVVGNRYAAGNYSTSTTGYVGKVTRLSDTSESYVYIRGEDSGEMKVHVDCFDLFTPTYETDISKMIEITPDMLPKKGDLVKVLSIDEMLEKYKNSYMSRRHFGFCSSTDVRIENGKYAVCYKGVEPELYITRTFFNYKREKSDFLAGHLFIVEDFNMVYGSTKVKILGNEENKDLLALYPGGYLNHSVCMEMLEVVEPNYVKKQLEREMEEYEKNMAKALEDEVIQEMISKVDKKTVKKIISSSLDMDARKITGVDKLLVEWATAKKELYLLLNNNLKITVEKELQLCTSEKRQLLEQLRKEFPRRILFHR